MYKTYYPTSLTDKQWQVIEKIVNIKKRKRKHSLVVSPQKNIFFSFFSKTFRAKILDVQDKKIDAFLTSAGIFQTPKKKQKQIPEPA